MSMSVLLAWIVALGGLLCLVLKDLLRRAADARTRRREADRSTYEERITRLIAGSLTAFIKSDRYRTEERGELSALVHALVRGEHRRRFVNRGLQSAWARFHRVSADYGWKRLTGTLSTADVDDYSRRRDDWIMEARKSLGQLPEIDCPAMRRELGNEVDAVDPVLSSAESA